MSVIRRIETYERPNLDELVAVWLAQRFLCEGEPSEVSFYPKPEAGACLVKEIVQHTTNRERAMADYNDALRLL